MNKQVPLTVEDVDSWHELQHLDEHGDDLSEWEIEFVESLMKQLKTGHWLTHKQKEKLHDIMEKRL